jgi:galactokinase/mevalonate kinase-like predicted kinase
MMQWRARAPVRFCMEVEYPNARIFPIYLDPSVICELEDRLVLIYTGKSHFSSGMHQKPIGTGVTW